MNITTNETILADNPGSVLLELVDVHRRTVKYELMDERGRRYCEPPVVGSMSVFGYRRIYRRKMGRAVV